VYKVSSKSEFSSSRGSLVSAISPVRAKASSVSHLELAGDSERAELSRSSLENYRYEAGLPRVRVNKLLPEKSRTDSRLCIIAFIISFSCRASNVVNCRASDVMDRRVFGILIAAY